MTTGKGNHNSQHPGDAIAIIGMSCRFPGARDLASFWTMLCNGVDAIIDIPDDRFNAIAVYDARSATPGKTVARKGGFIDGVKCFDNTFFGISPREAQYIDPQQRHLLEVSWEALEDAGEKPADLAKSNVGVFIGNIYTDYLDLQLRDENGLSLYSITGGSRSVASGRISYAFDFCGPSLTIDTACSSSLLAIHLARQSLQQGECQMALVGGVNLILQPEFSIGYSQANMLAPDGHCKTFDASADGFVRSEGVGVVVLKPLSQALQAGNPIYAVIRGSATANEGHGSGSLGTPGVESQSYTLQAAYQDAGISPDCVQYVEAHGTGTRVGDPVEIEALATILGNKESRTVPCFIGSVKTNIGHTEGAAGIAGLIKTALCLKHRLIPPHLNFQTPNPAIPWQTIPFRVPQQLTPFPDETQPLIAGVSAFGISGTNVHIVLEEPPVVQTQSKNIPVPRSDENVQLLPLSSHSATGLRTTLQAYARFFRIYEQRSTTRPSWRDICYTASLRRTHHEYRYAISARSMQEAADILERYQEDDQHNGATSHESLIHPPKIVFAFPGQGSQWIGMGRRLIAQEPVFYSALRQCEQVMKNYVSWSLLEQLTNDTLIDQFNDIDVIQPTIFAIQIALAALWRSWGIVPDAVVGHSMGEVAAACVAGIVSLDDAARIICTRSLLLKRVSGQGGMAVVGLALEQAQAALVGYEESLSIAVSNSPTATVISGDTDALSSLLARLQDQDIFCRPVKVDVASHSPQMDPLLDDLYIALQGIQPHPALIPMYSTVARELPPTFDTAYWVDNLRKPVLFSTIIQQLAANQHNIFIEISSHPILTSPIQQCLQHMGRERSTCVLASLYRDRDERNALFETACALYALNIPLDWHTLYADGGSCMPLPNYSWQQDIHWLQAIEPVQQHKRSFAHGRRYLPDGTFAHPLLQTYIHSAVQTHIHIWETELDPDVFPYMRDHYVQETLVLPATVYIEMALAASQEIFPGPSPTLEQIRLRKAFFLQSDRLPKIQLMITSQRSDHATFQFFSFEEGGDGIDAAPVLHAEGSLSFAQNTTSNEDAVALFHSIEQHAGESIESNAHYHHLSQHGLGYGPCFQAVQQVWQQELESTASISLPEMLLQEHRHYQVHPVLFDACLQIFAAISLAQAAAGDIYLPISIQRILYYQQPETKLRIWASIQSNQIAEKGTIEGNVFAYNEDGSLAIAIYGVLMQQVDQMSASRSIEDDLYSIEWTTTAALQGPSKKQTGHWLLLHDHQQVGTQLSDLFTTSGERVIQVFQDTSYRCVSPTQYHVPATSVADFQSLLHDVSQQEQTPLLGIVHLWSLTTPSIEQVDGDLLAQTQLPSTISALHLVGALLHENHPVLPRLVFVSQAAQAVEPMRHPISPIQAPLWGMGRALFNEHPELNCTLVDIDAADRAEIRALYREITFGNQHEQVVLRGEQRYIARLTSYRAMKHDEEQTDNMPEPSIMVDAAYPFQLVTTGSGSLEQLRLQEFVRTQPGPHEVEIQVVAAGLNFHDVLLAVGINIGEASPAFGYECTGIVKACGEAVSEFQIGDEVIAIMNPCLSSYVIVPESLVVPKPSTLSFAEAATIPAAFLTAYYALYYLGRLSHGERVLIHSATGGVGMAAVQLAKLAGAEIFASAGNEEKRAFLFSQGVHHVTDSRSLSFIKDVLTRTHGNGVDLILNSLTGEALTQGLTLLSPHGRFLEIGKRDIIQNTQLGLEHFQKCLSFFSIDMIRMIHDRTALLGQLFREVMNLFAQDKLQPLPFTTFSIKDAADAFRYMTQGRHMGKIILSFQEQDIPVIPLSQPFLFRSDASYLITGGLGGLGLTVADWMIQHGARDLILIGRHAPSPAAQRMLDTWQQDNVRLLVAQTDITQEQQVSALLQKIERTMPPLKGVIHSAGVLNDSTILQLDQQRFLQVMEPKVLGAWHLHRLTHDLPLDHFVLFSSMAGVLGSPGQSNYNAGNTFLDALAHLRQSQGLPALSINWGPWSEVGLAARQENRGKRLNSRGMSSFSPTRGLEAFAFLLAQPEAQLAFSPLDIQQWCQFYPSASNTSFLARLISSDTIQSTKSESSRQVAVRQALFSLTVEERLNEIANYLSSRVAKILGFTNTKIMHNQPLNRLGIDSLMAVELRDAIKVEYGIVIPFTILLKGADIQQLTQRIYDQLEQEMNTSEVAVPPTEPESEVERLSNQEVDILLKSLLTSDSDMHDLLQDVLTQKDQQG